MASDEVPAFGSEIRREFMLRDKSTFLNHGSYGSIPRCVHQRQIKYLEELESHPDIWFRYSMYKYLDKAVAKVADFMRVNAEDTFLLQNVTKAINTVVKNYPWKAGDGVLITDLTYGAVKVTCRVTMDTVHGAKLHKIDIEFPIQSEDDIVKKYEDYLAKNTDIKLAILDHITSPTSVVLPLKRLVEVCRKHGVLVAVDAAHAPGQLNVDINDIDADFYAGNLHKWVFSPRSTAFIWCNPRRRHSWFRPLVTSAFQYNSLRDAFAYEGTKDDIPYLCSMAGIDYFNRIGGLEKIHAHNTALVRQGVDYLERKWNTKRLEIPEEMRAPYLIVVNLPFIKGFSDQQEPDSDVHVFQGRNLVLQKLILDKYDVQVAIVCIQRKYMVRVCAQVYNTMEDFHRLGEAVLDLSLNPVDQSENKDMGDIRAALPPLVIKD